MKNRNFSLQMMKAGGSLLASLLAPALAHGCACGCGVFDVGAADMLPHMSGGMAYFNYDYQDQNRNWSGNSEAPAADNGDKEIRTSFFTLAGQYFFNRSWGAQIEIPYDNRFFKTTSADGQVVSLHWSDLGDVRLTGYYTGFFPNMDTGVQFGLKLPTGSFLHNDAAGDIDRDSELGSGSTDLLLGGYHESYFDKGHDFAWFGQFLYDQPLLTQQGYRPGLELDAGAGVYYNHLRIGRLKIAPIAQIIGSFRGSDSGPNASGGINSPPFGEPDSGYQRLLLSPGIELDWHPFRFYMDVEFPVYQQMTGNQLVAAQLWKFSFSYMF